MDRCKYKNKLRKKRAMRHRKKIIGTQERPRLSVFRSLKHICGQLIDDRQGVSLFAVSSLDPSIRKEAGSGKIPKAEAVGRRIAEKSKEMGICRVYFDVGSYRYHGRVKALAEKVLEGGIQF